MIWQIQIIHVVIQWSIFASLWTLLYASILKRLFVLSLKISDHGDFIQTKKLKNLESRVEYILWNLCDMLVHRFFPLHHQYVITSILTREEAAIVPDTRSFGILKSIFQTDSESYQGFNIHLEISLSSRSTKMKIGVFTCCKEVYQTLNTITRYIRWSQKSFQWWPGVRWWGFHSGELDRPLRWLDPLPGYGLGDCLVWGSVDWSAHILYQHLPTNFLEAVHCHSYIAHSHRNSG